MQRLWMTGRLYQRRPRLVYLDKQSQVLFLQESSSRVEAWFESQSCRPATNSTHRGIYSTWHRVKQEVAEQLVVKAAVRSFGPGQPEKVALSL